MTSIIGRLWTPEEDAILRANPGLSMRQLAALIPGRTESACAKRRFVLGLRVEVVVPPATPEEDAILRTHPAARITKLRSLLPSRSEGWIYRRKIDLGLGAAARSNWQAKAAAARGNNIRQATEAIRVESLAKRLEPEGTAYRTTSGQPARIIKRFPMPDVPSVYGP
jgi:hypothetical protein